MVPPIPSPSPTRQSTNYRKLAEDDIREANNIVCGCDNEDEASAAQINLLAALNPFCNKPTAFNPFEIIRKLSIN